MNVHSTPSIIDNNNITFCLKKSRLILRIITIPGVEKSRF